jgi:hypothetical protein
MKTNLQNSSRSSKSDKKSNSIVTSALIQRAKKINPHQIKSNVNHTLNDADNLENL